MLRELCDLEPACGWAVKNLQNSYPNPYDKTGNIRFLNPNLHPHITRHFRTAKFCDIESAHEDIKAKAKAMFFEQMALVEQELDGRTWFFDHNTACDAYFFWVYDRALREYFDLSQFSNCTAHYEAMKKRPNVQRALAHTQ